MRDSGCQSRSNHSKILCKYLGCYCVTQAALGFREILLTQYLNAEILDVCCYSRFQNIFVLKCKKSPPWKFNLCVQSLKYNIIYLFNIVLFVNNRENTNQRSTHVKVMLNTLIWYFITWMKTLIPVLQTCRNFIRIFSEIWGKPRLKHSLN